MGMGHTQEQSMEHTMPTSRAHVIRVRGTAGYKEALEGLAKGSGYGSIGEMVVALLGRFAAEKGVDLTDGALRFKQTEWKGKIEDSPPVVMPSAAEIAKGIRDASDEVRWSVVTCDAYGEWTTLGHVWAPNAFSAEKRARIEHPKATNLKIALSMKDV